VAKLERPPLLVWIRPGRAIPALSGQKSYYKTGAPQEGWAPKEAEVARATYIVVFPPDSEVLYVPTLEAELEELQDEEEIEAAMEEAEDMETRHTPSAVLYFWVPFRETEAPGGVGPAVQFPGWVYHQFSTLDEIADFVRALISAPKYGPGVERRRPVVPPLFPELAKGKPADKLEREWVQGQAERLGISPRYLAEQIRERAPLLKTYAAALECPAPTLARRLLQAGVAPEEMQRGARWSQAATVAVDRMAREAGVSRAYLTRVLRGQGVTAPDGTFKPYAIPKKLR
jgi:AraC-like DNA-binding protein